MRELNGNEVNEVSGGWFWIVARILAPTVINMIVYGWNKHNKGDAMTATGLVIAGGAGALSGGASAGLGAAAGGGLLGAAVWAPTTTTINATGNAIARQY